MARGGITPNGTNISTPLRMTMIVIKIKFVEKKKKGSHKILTLMINLINGR